MQVKSAERWREAKIIIKWNKFEHAWKYNINKKKMDTWVIDTKPVIYLTRKCNIIFLLFMLYNWHMMFIMGAFHVVLNIFFFKENERLKCRSNFYLSNLMFWQEAYILCRDSVKVGISFAPHNIHTSNPIRFSSNITQLTGL